MNPQRPGWDLEEDDFGGVVVRHLHGDVSATTYLYSNPETAWAECTMCGAQLTLDARGMGGLSLDDRVGARDREG